MIHPRLLRIPVAHRSQLSRSHGQYRNESLQGSRSLRRRLRDHQRTNRLQKSGNYKHTPALIRLGMRSYAPYPTSSKRAQKSRNITGTRISPKNNSRRLFSQRKRNAILEIHPAPSCFLALLGSRREYPVDLDDGVVFVLDLRARLFDFRHRVVIWSEETVSRVVAC
jgi:hypothetical protein